jgi:sugar phosphate isomerase/epimerase
MAQRMPARTRVRGELTRVHPRLSINSLSTARWTLSQDLDLYARLGIGRAGLYVDKLEAAGSGTAVEQVLAAGISVSHVFTRGPTPSDPSRWPDERARLIDAVEVGAGVGAPLLSLTTGPAGGLPWDRAVEGLAEALAPVQAAAEGRGMQVAIEQTLPVRVEIGFVHSLRDSVEVAHRTGLRVVMEANYCSGERDLASTIRAAAPVLGMVQLSDLVPPSTTIPDRAVPGDGVLPLASIIEMTLAAGYAGAFELETMGARIEEEGYESACRRGLAVLDELLTAAGA